MNVHLFERTTVIFLVNALMLVKLIHGVPKYSEMYIYSVNKCEIKYKIKDSMVHI